MEIKKGKIYQKQTESWAGNDEKGTEVKITHISGNFVKFRKLKKVLWFKVKSGKPYILNKWSFRRIYIDSSEPTLYFSDGEG
jgi:FlaG/FlaF family flagellin (archaellin)